MQGEGTMRVAAAICGIAASFDGCDGLAEFERAMLTAARRGAPLPFDESTETLTARLVDAALVDAGFRAPGTAHIALVLLGDHTAMSQRLATAAAASHPVGAPIVSFAPGGFAAALRCVGDLLDDDALDAVVLAGVSEPPSPVPPLTSAETASEPPSLGFDRIPRCHRPCRGGAAVVLMRNAAERPTRGIYATLAVAGWAPTVLRATTLALAKAEASSGEVGYIEAWAAADGATSDDEGRGLAAAYPPSPSGEPTTGVAGVVAVLGDVGAAAHTVAVLARAALALSDRFVPGVPTWKGPRDPMSWRASSLYVPDAARPWFVPVTHARVAAGQVIEVGSEGSTAIHMVLREEPRARRVTPRFRAIAPLQLVPLVGSDPDALLDALTACEAALAGGADPARVAANSYAAAKEHLRHASGEVLAMALLGRDRDELAQEIASARRSFPRALETGDDWQTPRGSCFAPRPVGARGTVAFVYPGAFTAYPGVLRDTFQIFPSLHEPRGAWPSDVGRALAQHLLYPRGVEPLDAAGQAAFEERLYAHPAEMISAATLSAGAYTRVMREVFGLQPAAAFGYSLGETTMCWALGVWTDGDSVAEELLASDLFRTRLGGPREALREFWVRRGRPDRAQAGAWASHVLVTTASNVKAALEAGDAEDVFLLAVHGPTEVVIGGAPEACTRLIARLRCDHVPMPFPLMLHSEVLATEYDRFVAANRRPTSTVSGIAFHSAGEPRGGFVPETDEMAQRIARMVMQPLDFSALIERVYAEGARIFLELGPNASCSRLVTANLRGREHVAVAMDRRGVDAQTGVLRALARLFAHRAPMDLAALYEGTSCPR
jgi:PfaB family protein